LRFFAPFSPSLASKLAKSAGMKISKQKSLWVSKKAKFYADFKSGEKLLKNSPFKSYCQKTDEKIVFFNFYS